MFCTSCGAQLQTDQRSCASCGKPTSPSMTAVSTATLGAPGQARVARHVHLLAILWIALSALQLLRGAGSLVGARLVRNVGYYWFGGTPWAWPIGISNVLSFGSLISIAMAVGGFVVAVGLLERRSWARTLAIVLAVIALLHPLLGTALGVFTLWVLLPSNSETEWRRIARSS